MGDKRRSKMNNRKVRILACALTATIAFSGMGISAEAASLSSVLPSAGIGITLFNGTSLQEIQKNTLVTSQKVATPISSSEVKKLNQLVSSNDIIVTPSAKMVAKNSAPGSFGANALDLLATSVVGATGPSVTTLASSDTVASKDVKKIEETQTATTIAPMANVPAENDDTATTEEPTAETTEATTAETEAEKEEKEFSSLVIAQVNDYVNVRDIPSEEGNIVGKLYDKSVGTFISEKDGWYEINSGNCTGFVKAEYCVTGDAAISLAKEVGTRIATVTTTTLKVREQPSTESAVLGLVPIEEDLVVTEEQEGWVKVNIEEGDGYVSTEFVTLRTDFVKAESKEEEEARLAKEEAERKAAKAAAAAAAAKKSASQPAGTATADPIVVSGGSETGNAVASYACQFVGNPYVYGGSSLTNGTDCSGFVMSVYANFGVGLPHSSSGDRSVGSNVGSLDNAQPGDIVCYSGHVGIYIGNGQIVHASTSRTGIIVSNASYRSILAVRRIF